MKHQLITDWLKNAYAMEKSIAEVLAKQLDDAKENPTLHTKLQQHLEQTHHHAEQVKERIEALGDDISSWQTGMAKVMGKTEGLMMSLPDQKLTAHTIADYAAEHFEIATYAAIVHAAIAMGDNDTAELCQNILRDEIDMANWLYENINTVVQQEAVPVRQPA